MRARRAWVLAGVAVLALVVALIVVLGNDGGGDESEAGATVVASGDAKQEASEKRAGEEQQRGGRRVVVEDGKTVIDLSDGETGPSPGGPPPTIVVANGRAVGGVKEIVYDKWDKIRFRVKSDAADAFHVDGYDATERVKAGGSARFFDWGSHEGTFDVVLASSREPIARLRVVP